MKMQILHFLWIFILNPFVQGGGSPPKIKEVKPVTSNKLQLKFSNPMDERFATQIDYYGLRMSGNSESMMPECITKDGDTYQLIFANEFENNITYCLDISSMPDQKGDLLQDTSVCFDYKGVVIPQKGDVLCSEIMFDVDEYHLEYLEIYNASDKVIRFIDLGLAALQTDFTLKKGYSFMVDSFQVLQPYSYYVLCKEVDDFPKLFVPCQAENVIRVKSMPSLSNTEGAWAIILSKDTTFLDFFYYNAKMHFPLLKSTKNVSLERISWFREAVDFNNWISSCEANGFSTPACPNSKQEYPLVEGGYFTFSSEVISPNQDGFNDRLEIKYALDQTGWVGNVRIYDANGRMVTHLVNQEYLQSSGSFFWDGLSVQKQPLRSGLYIIHIHLLNLEGRVVKAKEAVVLR